MRTIVVVLAGLVTSPAWAQSSYQPYLLGLRTAGMGGAAVALGHDSAMPWKNPAGLARGQGAQLGVASNSLVLSENRAAEYFGLSDDYRRTRGILEGDFRSTIEGSSVGVFPNSISFSVPLDDDHNFLGLAFIAPVAEVQDALTDVTFDTGAGFSTHRFDQEVRELRYYAFGPTYAVRLGETVRLGLAVFMRYASLRERYSLERSDHELASRDVGVDATESSVEGDGFDLDVAAGLQVGPIGGLHFGLAAHAPSINLFGHYSEHERNYCGDCIEEGVIQIATFDAVGDHFDQASPAWFSAGIGYERPRAFAIAVDVSFWLPVESYAWTTVDADLSVVINDAALPRQSKRDEGVPYYSDARAAVVNVNVGAEVYLADRLALRAGFFTDFSAVPELPPEAARTPEDRGRRRQDRFGASLGVGYEGRATSLQLGLVYLGGVGELVGLQFNADGGDSFPTRELASNVFMLSFSGEVDAGHILSAAGAAIGEEVGR